jgi:hypothetical protein
MARLLDGPGDDVRLLAEWQVFLDQYLGLPMRRLYSLWRKDQQASNESSRIIDW